ncbi:MAG: group II intron reverse transcriptase/maturase [Phycisphaerales bacterium]
MEVFTKQQRIAALGKRFPERSFTSLHHYLDTEWLTAAYRTLNAKSAPGVDGVTVQEYGQNLRSNLEALLERVHKGQYRAACVKRGWVPKGSNPKGRPIGMPTTEDKVLQRGVKMIVEPLYEPLFRDCSYGFRPGRSPHMALEALWQAIMRIGGGWVLDVDVRKFFDTLDQGHLKRLLKQRVSDGVISRLFSKWLHAGVMEEERVFYPEQGTPQGGTISPLFSNVYLHYVLDVWFEDEVLPRLSGKAVPIRFADDFVLVFEHQHDAECVRAVLPKRFGKYGLQLHASKTQLIDFRPPDKTKQEASFQFLGFTHFWGRSRRGHTVVKRKTASARLTRSIKSIRQWCRQHRHHPVAWQRTKLVLKVRGHYLYYGITGNIRSLNSFYEQVRRIWRYWLNRRTRGRPMPWARFESGVLQHYPLPPPRIYHSYAKAKP